MDTRYSTDDGQGGVSKLGLSLQGYENFAWPQNIRLVCRNHSTMIGPPFKRLANGSGEWWGNAQTLRHFTHKASEAHPQSSWPEVDVCSGNSPVPRCFRQFKSPCRLHSQPRGILFSS